MNYTNGPSIFSDRFCVRVSKITISDCAESIGDEWDTKMRLVKNQHFFVVLNWAYQICVPFYIDDIFLFY